MIHFEIIAAFLYIAFSKVSGSFTIASYSAKKRVKRTRTYTAETDAQQDESSIPKKSLKDNQAMAFLRRKGLVGGNKDFSNAIGIDEGEGGKNGPGGEIKKSRQAYLSCVESGIIDDCSEPFPIASCGSEWSGISDRIVGGLSTGFIVREDIDGRTCNVLRGKLSLLNNGGFIQMVVNLAQDPSIARFVDVSDYDGIKLDVFYQGESQVENFNVHLKTVDCVKSASYRGTFEVTKNEWKTIMLPWSEFQGHSVENDSRFDPTQLCRVGVVAIGKEMEVSLAVSNIGFYSIF